ncbi:MAG: ABC transporter substrate-binding protein [Thermodesulfobacteriota bacterium]
MKKKIWLSAVLLLLTLPVSYPALAETPTSFVKGILDGVLAIQNDPALASASQEPARARAIRQIIQKNFDFSLMARNSLGPTYGRLSAGQRREFQEIFAALFQDSYTRMVLNFLKQETIKYQQERQDQERARVNTTIIRTNEAIPVEYLMLRQGQGWRLYDVVVDGVSILDNYQKNFAQVIKSNSFDFLLGKMKTQYRAIQ